MSTDANSTNTAADGIRRMGGVAWALTGVAVVVAIALWILAKVSIVYTPIILGGIIVFLLNPIVTWLDDHGVRRIWGAIGTYLTFVIVLTGLGFLLAPFVGDQVVEFVDRLPEITKKIESWLTDVSQRYSILQPLDPDELSETFGNFASTLGQRPAIIQIGGNAVKLIVEIVLAPIIALYVLIDLPRIAELGKRLIPQRARPEVVYLLGAAGRIGMNFFRGQLVVAVLVASMSIIGFTIAGVPFAVPIGIAAGIFNIVPYLGPWIGGALAVLVSFVVADPLTALFATIVAVVVQQIDNHFVSPLVMRKAVQVHPAAVILGLLAGGALFGLWGVLLAVPAIALFKLIAGYFWRTRVLREPHELASAIGLACEAEVPKLATRTADEGPTDPTG